MGKIRKPEAYACLSANLADWRSMSTRQIAAAMAAEGHSVSHETIERWLHLIGDDKHNAIMAQLPAAEAARRTATDEALQAAILNALRILAATDDPNDLKQLAAIGGLAARLWGLNRQPAAVDISDMLPMFIEAVRIGPLGAQPPAPLDAHNGQLAIEAETAPQTPLPFEAQDEHNGNKQQEAGQ